MVVAGRPSSGKSVVCQDYLLSSMKQGKRVLFASAEMDEKDDARKAGNCCVW